MVFQDLALNYTTLSVCPGVLSAIFLYFYIIYPLFYSPLSQVPGPPLCKLSWYYISYFDLLLQRNDKIQEWHEKYGPIVCIRPEEVSFSSPAFMREIYGISGKYSKSNYFDNFIAYGERAVFSVGPYHTHRHKRALISNFYQFTSLYKFGVEASMQERVHAFLNKMDHAMLSSPYLDIYPMISHYVFDNITCLLYGHRHGTSTIENDHEERQILSGLKKIQLWGPFQYTFPLIYKSASKVLSYLNIHRNSFDAKHNLNRWNYKRFMESTADFSVDKDNSLVRRLTGANDPDGNPLSQNYIAAELLDNLNAGQEITAVALVYIVYHLSRNPEWQAKLRDELRALQKQSGDHPSFASIDRAPILEACIREAYRINPGSSGRAERVVPEGGKEFGRFYLPEGVCAPSIFSRVICADPDRPSSRHPPSPSITLLPSSPRPQPSTPSAGCQHLPPSFTPSSPPLSPLATGAPLSRQSVCDDGDQAPACGSLLEVRDRSGLGEDNRGCDEAGEHAGRRSEGFEM